MYTYKQLLRELSKIELFCPVYTLKHMTVDEVFPYSKNAAEWDDVADKRSLLELFNR